MKAIWQYFPTMLFIMLYKVALTTESVDEALIKCCHLNESSVLSRAGLFKARRAGLFKAVPGLTSIFNPGPSCSKGD